MDMIVSYRYYNKVIDSNVGTYIILVSIDYNRRYHYVDTQPQTQ